MINRPHFSAIVLAYGSPVAVESRLNALPEVPNQGASLSQTPQEFSFVTSSIFYRSPAKLEIPVKGHGRLVLPNPFSYNLLKSLAPLVTDLHKRVNYNPLSPTQFAWGFRAPDNRVVGVKVTGPDYQMFRDYMANRGVDILDPKASFGRMLFALANMLRKRGNHDALGTPVKLENLSPDPVGKWGVLPSRQVTHSQQASNPKTPQAVPVSV